MLDAEPSSPDDRKYTVANCGMRMEDRHVYLPFAVSPLRLGFSAFYTCALTFFPNKISWLSSTSDTCDIRK